MRLAAFVFVDSRSKAGFSECLVNVRLRITLEKDECTERKVAARVMTVIKEDSQQNRTPDATYVLGSRLAKGHEVRSIPPHEVDFAGGSHTGNYQLVLIHRNYKYVKRIIARVECPGRSTVKLVNRHCRGNEWLHGSQLVICTCKTLKKQKLGPSFIDPRCANLLLKLGHSFFQPSANGNPSIEILLDLVSKEEHRTDA